MAIRCLNEKDTGVGLFTNAGGEVAAARAPKGKSSGAGAKPELPVCEQAGFARSQAALKKGVRIW